MTAGIGPVDANVACLRMPGSYAADVRWRLHVVGQCGGQRRQIDHITERVQTVFAGLHRGASGLTVLRHLDGAYRTVGAHWHQGLTQGKRRVRQRNGSKRPCGVGACNQAGAAAAPFEQACKRETDRPATGNHNGVSGVHDAAARHSLINASISSGCLGTPLVRISQPPAHTATSSSIRTPIFQYASGTVAAGRM